VTLSILVLGFVTLQRGAELLLARRNARDLLASGAIEASPGHYPLLVGLHAAWLAGLWLWGWNAEIRLGWLAAFAILQLLRLWVIVSLGRRWTTRIIVTPRAPLSHQGPYRFLAHPNYLVVTGEIAVLPLAFGLPLYALLFSLANAAVLAVRIRAENAALAGLAVPAGLSEAKKQPDRPMPPQGSSSASQ
jgi:methyltransferase